MITEKPLVLFGGGLDSGALVEWLMQQPRQPLAPRPTLLYLDYGAKAREGEIVAVRYFSDKYSLPYERLHLADIVANHPLVDGETATKHAENYIPGRNLLFASVGTSYAASFKLDPVVMGFHREPSDSVYEDAKPSFVSHFNALTFLTYGVEYPVLAAPFAHRERVDYIEEALRTEPDLFARTFSCYESRSIRECGKCTHCAAKQALLAEVEKRRA